MKSSKRIIEIVFFLIPILIILILSNSIMTKGHIIFYSSALFDVDIIDIEGYKRDGSDFHVVSNNPHVTFMNNEATNEFSILMCDSAKEDIVIPVKLHDEAGKVLDEYNVTWEKGEKLLSFDVSVVGTRSITLSIDDDFSVYQIVCSIPYHDYKRRGAFLVGATFLFILLYWIMYKNGTIIDVSEMIVKRLDTGISSFRANKHIYIKSTLLRFLIVILSLFVSLLILFILWKSGIKSFGYEIRPNYRNVLVVTILLSYIGLVMIDRKHISERLPSFTFWSIFTVGSALIISQSGNIGISWDDPTHMKQIVHLSRILDSKINLAEWNMYFRFWEYPFTAEATKRLYDIYESFYDANFLQIVTDYKFSLSQIVYFPMAIGFSLARGLMLPMHIGVMFAKWFNLIHLAICSSLAVRKLKYGRFVVFVVAMIPTNIFLACNISYDTWVVAWTILGYGYLFGEIQDRDNVMSKKSMIIISVSLLLATLSKMVYFILVIPAIFISIKKFSGKLAKWLYRMMIIFATFFPFIMMMFMNVINSGVSGSRGGDTVDSGSQMNFIMNHFVFYIKLLVRFLFGYLNPFSEKMGGNTYIDNYAYAGTIGISGLVMIIVLIAILIDHDDEKGLFPVWYRIGILVVYVGVGAICASAMYISFTPVGLDTINGCQGRYLLPAIFPTYFVLSRIPTKTRLKNKIGENNLYTIIGLLMFAFNMCGIWKLFLVRY